MIFDVRSLQPIYIKTSLVNFHYEIRDREVNILG